MSYSTEDEYINAMKKDLAEWLNSMYYNQQSSSIQSLLSALNFTDELENGLLICFHANCVMKKAQLNEFTFNLNDLNRAGIVNACSLMLSKTTASALNKKTNKTPSSKLNHLMSGEFLLYKSTARFQSFHARDNISNFIKFCRHVVKVRECLMFETDDLVMRKNEKHFILCLLEVARFGARFGMQVPTIIRYEQEIEVEIEREKQRKLKHQTQHDDSLIVLDSSNDDDNDKKFTAPSPPPQPSEQPKEVKKLVQATILPNGTLTKLKLNKYSEDRAIGGYSPNNFPIKVKDEKKPNLTAGIKMMSMDDKEQDKKMAAPLNINKTSFNASSLQAAAMRGSTTQMNNKYQGYEEKLKFLSQKLIEEMESKPDADASYADMEKPSCIKVDLLTHQLYSMKWLKWCESRYPHGGIFRKII
jgi:hypothetical protein